MIKKATDKINLSGVSSPLLPLIYCDFSFNSGDSEGVYFQYNENDEITAVFSLRNGCITLAGIGESNISELFMFFKFAGVSEVLSDFMLDDSCEDLPLLKASARCVSNSDISFLDVSSTLGEYQSVYKLLSERGDNFPCWYSVFSKKINSSFACGAYKKDNGLIVSTATATAIYEKNAVISGVFTNSLYRGKGYATECVEALINKLYHENVSNILLWCEEDKIPFYEKIGFNVSGRIYLRKV